MNIHRLPSLLPHRRPLRLLAATAMLALAAGLALPVLAQPMPGPGGPGMGIGMGMGMGMGHGMGQGRELVRMLDAVNASAEQRTQIRQLAQTARAELRSQHEAGRKLHEQSQALFAQPTIDANQAEALRQQMMALHDKASKRMLQLMLDVSNVLTPEQRKMLADRMAQRHSMMERHRAERDALDPKKP